MDDDEKTQYESVIETLKADIAERDRIKEEMDKKISDLQRIISDNLIASRDKSPDVSSVPKSFDERYADMIASNAKE